MDLRRAAPWARAAGVAGMSANVLLVAFYAVEAGRRRVLPVSLGSANDVVGSVGTALMVPVVLAVSPGRWTRRLGLTATGVLTVAGPALVLGLVPFAVQMPVAIGAFEALAGWLVLSSRGRRGALPAEVTRLGLLSGGGVLAGGAAVGVGLLLPKGSVPRRAALAVGGVPGGAGWLAMPWWFLRLARALTPGGVGG
ncbi:hypothetical protein GCU56_05780 [Geodermatophilus sabuli]|uniref:Uncharacterized protein n=1 Tax=Geodermatophilus sabuli TaxID=1564158 RepID=A0A7K3VXP4_9ACTN|nr:hypothetical protein [Geodermatophilus sabuli]NEK57382.1 hypothetical protein [Geodermatophilus sabuli]